MILTLRRWMIRRVLEGLHEDKDRFAVPPDEALPGALVDPELAPAPRFGQLTLSSKRAGDVHTIHLFGELDLAGAESVERELLRVEATDARMILLDLSGLMYLDSTGVRLLLGAHARSCAGGDRLALVPGCADVQRVFELCRVADLLPFV